MNKEKLITRMNTDAQALQEVRFMAGKLFDHISEIWRAGKDTSPESARVNESLLRAGRKLWAAGIDPITHWDQSTLIF